MRKSLFTTSLKFQGIIITILLFIYTQVKENGDLNTSLTLFAIYLPFLFVFALINCILTTYLIDKTTNNTLQFLSNFGFSTIWMVYFILNKFQIELYLCKIDTLSFLIINGIFILLNILVLLYYKKK